MKFMFWWKMFVYETEKALVNVCFHSFTLGWIKPYDVAFGFFFLFPFGFLHFALSKLSKLYLNFSLYLELTRFCSWDGAALRNISLDNITEIILLILILGSALWLMVEGQNLCGCISFRCLFFYKACMCHYLDQRWHRDNLWFSCYIQ